MSQKQLLRRNAAGAEDGQRFAVGVRVPAKRGQDVGEERGAQRAVVEAGAPEVTLQGLEVRGFAIRGDEVGDVG